MLKRVVLPAPLGPMRETIRSGCTVKSTSLTATRPPKRLVSRRTSSSTPSIRPGPGAGRPPPLRRRRLRGRSPGGGSARPTRGAPAPRRGSSSALRERERRPERRPWGRSTISSTRERPKTIRRRRQVHRLEQARQAEGPVQGAGEGRCRCCPRGLARACSQPVRRSARMRSKEAMISPPSITP